MSTVSAAATLGGLVNLNALDDQGGGVETLAIGVGLSVLEQIDDVLSGLDGPAGLGDTELLSCKPKIVSRCSTPFTNFHPDRRSTASPISQEIHPLVSSMFSSSFQCISQWLSYIGDAVRPPHNPFNSDPSGILFKKK